ncbi:trimethyllysine dioxygenase, mitochondrial-like isoform X2 [Ptychodera flava]|uniref:trimethyllysine dioxygenase, mitochondrial-like isoform X2 n=1 Tax=Ptychodera flava TaxID=63121 RepID=UPI003969C6FA
MAPVPNVRCSEAEFRCMECFNHTTHQREVDIRSLNVDIVPKQVVLETTGNGKQLCIVWPDGHQSTYSFDWMVNNICTGTNLSDLSKMLRLWDAKRLEDSPPVTVSFGKYISGDEHLKMVLQNLAEYGFAIVTDTPATIEHTQKVAERISIIRETLYGKMYSFTNELEYADTAYSSVALRAHTDTTYFSEPSGLQVFHCISHDGDGGKTLLVDGFQAAQTLKHQHPEYYQILSQVNLSHRFIDNINNFCFEGIGPILQHHPLTRELICIRFNTYDRSTITHLESEDVYNFYQALSALAEQIASEKNEFWIKLWPGSVLIVDNWRVLHGRSSYTGNRKVCGCYLPRDDLISRYRTLLNISV